jgi:hypothetical protein
MLQWPVSPRSQPRNARFRSSERQQSSTIGSSRTPSTRLHQSGRRAVVTQPAKISSGISGSTARIAHRTPLAGTGRDDRQGRLAILCEHELAERATRRIARHMTESGLPAGKTLETFVFAAAPSVREAHITALATGNAWIGPGANILIFGPSGTG